MDYMVQVFLLGLIVFIEIRSYFERKNLLDRIMARSYDEYASLDLASRTAKIKVPDKFSL